MAEPATSNGSEAPTPVQILHLEDEITDHELLVRAVKAGGVLAEFQHVTSQPEFEAALTRQTFDLIISDFSLPAFDGLAALAEAQKIQPGTPFLFVSGTIGEERAVESLKSGAIDYILKDNLRRLVPAMHRALREARERNERRKLQEQLRHAQKMEAIGQLAGGVAHDFNNLLAVICGNVELVLLRNELVSRESRDCLTQVIAASARATNLTRQLLAFGRKQVMQEQTINLNDVITNLAKMLKRVIGTNVHLEYAFADQRAYVKGDVGMMEQILVNLIVNARDAMPGGGQLVISTERVRLDAAQVAARPEARPGEFICWAVSDTGTGIAPEHLPHIFEPFYTTKAPGKGTGLGLATVYGIVKQHQGWVEIATREGAGTTFKIFLPAVKPTTAEHETDFTTGIPRGGGERILLVEDDPAVRPLTRRILETFGYEVLAAGSGAEALEQAGGANDIRLLLTGLVMPDGMTGPDLAARLRQDTPTLKVILVSGHTRELARLDGEPDARRVDGFLQKPCASQVLITAVRRCLDGKPVEQS